MQDTTDVVVIGAGIVGAAVAYHLARRGSRVTVLEQDSIGSGASAHATGSLSILGAEFTEGPSFDLAVAAYDDFIELVPQLQQETGADLLYQRRVSVRLALDEDEERVIRDTMVWQQTTTPVEWIDAAAVHAIEPRLTPDLRGAAYQPESAQLDSYRLNLALAQGAEHHGATILQRKATSIERTGGRVTGVGYEGGSVACGAVVLAMGAWSEDSSDWLGFPVPVKPMKGERLLLRYGGEPLACLISSPKRGHMISRLDGYLSVGSTGGRDYDEREAFVGVEFDRQPTEQAKMELIQRALDVFPGLEEAEVVQQLAGSRPLSVDRRPIIGPVPGNDGVFLATGHGTKGIHLAPITGRIIADYVAGQEPGVSFDMTPFLPARFANLQAPDFGEAADNTEE